MRRTIASALALLLLAATLPAPAAPLAPAAIPQSAKWVIHINVDAARGTPLWEFARIRFVVPREDDLRARARNIETITGARFPRDLHDVTLYGTDYDQSSVCILIHAAFNQQQTLTSLKRNPEFSSINHNSRTIFGWRERPGGRLMYGAFLPGDVAALSPNLKAVTLALDTFDRKSPTLPPDSPLISMPPASTRPSGPQVLWIAGIDLSELPRAQQVDSAPFLLQMDNARLALSLNANRLNTRLVVTAKSEKAAQQLAAIAEGRKAMVTLSAADDRATPRVKRVASVLQDMAVATDGKVVSADLSIGMEQLDEFFLAARGAAAAAARGAAAAAARGDAPPAGRGGRGAGAAPGAIGPRPAPDNRKP